MASDELKANTSQIHPAMLLEHQRVLSDEENDKSTAQNQGFKDAARNEKEAISSNSEGNEESEISDASYPQGLLLGIIVSAIALSNFVAALDSTIIGTAIPRITNEFHGLDKVSWYGSAYFMTFGGFQSCWGKVFKYFPLKSSFLIAMFIFELGSLICGVAPSATVLIVGRAITGLGGAGLSTGAFTIIGLASPPRLRPTFTGITGASYGVAAVLGPLVGGAFSQGVTWRWCFYINLPIGGLAAASIFFFFRVPNFVRPVNVPLREKILQLDLVGVTLVMASIISFTLAFSYGGEAKSWGSSIVIGLIIGFFVISLSFIAWETFQADRAMLPKHLFVRRSVWVNGAFAFFIAASYYLAIYYLPYYFQSVQDVGAIESGVHNLPLLGAVIFTTSSTGALVSKTGHIVPVMVIGGALAAISSGLFYTLDEHTSTGKWVGYQIIGGAGWGASFQMPIIYAQSQASVADMSTVTAIIMFFLQLGGAFGLSAAQSGFTNRLLSTARTTAPNVTRNELLQTGVSQIWSVFRDKDLYGVITAYVSGLRVVWALTAALAVGATFSAAANSWKRLSFVPKEKQSLAMA